MSILSPGATFGSYRIVESIGRGGMASVFKAYEAALDRFVALKVLPPEFLHEPTFAARFEREARLIAKLEHQNIIPIFAFGIEQHIPWMAMRLIGGGSLSGSFKDRMVPRRRALEIIRAVADALTYAHDQGVVHRDVKPQNILLDEKGHVYLADFGIARIVEGGPSITRTGMVSGTPQYMAPEQATGKPMDHRVDVYALGVVAYELFTGAAPFSADTPVAVMMKQVSAEIPIPPPEQVPKAMLGALLKSLAKDPAERWYTASQFADALETGFKNSTAQVEVLAQTEVLTARIPAPTTKTAVPPAVVPPPAVPPTTAAPTVVPVTVVPPPVVPPPVAPPPVATTIHRSGVSMGTIAIAVILLLLLTGLVVAWQWLRAGTNQVETASAEPPTQATPAPVTPAPLETPAPAPVVETPAAVPARETPPAPVAPSPRPVVAPKPAPPRSTSDARAANPAPSTPVSATPAPAPPPPPPPPPPAPAPPKDARPFKVNAPIEMSEQTVFPVTLRFARFNVTRPGEMELALDVFCAKSHDQMVTYEVELFDEAGRVVLTLRGRKGIEEGDKGTFKQKQKIAANLLDTVKAFRVTFTTVDD